MSFETGDIVRLRKGHQLGVVFKVVGAQGHYHAVVVVNWADGTRTTEWQEYLRKVSKS